MKNRMAFTPHSFLLRLALSTAMILVVARPRGREDPSASRAAVTSTQPVRGSRWFGRKESLPITPIQVISAL